MAGRLQTTAAGLIRIVHQPVLEAVPAGRECTLAGASGAAVYGGGAPRRWRSGGDVAVVTLYNWGFQRAGGGPGLYKR